MQFACRVGDLACFPVRQAPRASSSGQAVQNPPIPETLLVRFRGSTPPTLPKKKAGAALFRTGFGEPGRVSGGRVIGTMEVCGRDPRDLAQSLSPPLSCLRS